MVESTPFDRSEWQHEDQLVIDFREFLERAESDAGPIYDEPSFQMELGCFLRMRGLRQKIEKPTGGMQETVVLSGSYDLARCWRDLTNTRLLTNARYLLVLVEQQAASA